MDHDGTWTIDELVDRAATVLSSGRPLPKSGRIRDVPNARLVRWYVTIGLMDPPLSRRGRVARYGRRHLLQLVAVKRRQAEGHSLAEIQVELAGATDETLRTIARLPGNAESDTAGVGGAADVAGAADGAAPGAEDAADLTGPGGAPAAGTGHDRASVDRDRFWAQRPALPRAGRAADDRAGSADRVGTDGRVGTDAHAGGVDQAAADDGTDSVIYGIRLAPGVTLLLDMPAAGGHRPAPRRRPHGPAGPPDDDARAAIRAAARPLLDELARRGHLPPAAATTPPAPGSPSGPPPAKGNH